MRQRPLSPHLQVYKLPAAAVISITHRFFSGVWFLTGIAFAVYCLLLLSHVELDWLFDLTFSWWGKLKISFILPFLFFYALAEGRYIIWGCNVGFSKKFVSTSNVVILLGSALCAGLSAWYIWS